MLFFLLLVFQAYLLICYTPLENYKMAMISEGETLSGTQGFKTRQVTSMWLFESTLFQLSLVQPFFFDLSPIIRMFFYAQRKVCSLCVCFLVPISVKKTPRTLPMKSQERVLVMLQTALAGCYNQSSVKITLYDSIWLFGQS